MEIIIIKIDENDVKVTRNREEPKKDSTYYPVSQYARWFDDACYGWTKDSEYNMAFLKAQQEYANQMLKSKGHLFLNEVYDMLSIPRTKAGAIVGWVYDEDDSIGNNFVDFGLTDKRNSDFINGFERTVLLDFNVDGVILDYL